MPKPSVIFNENGQPMFIWPRGATLAGAGFRLVEPRREERRMSNTNPVQVIERIATSRGINFDEALQTPEGARVYAEYRTGLFAKQASPRLSPSETPSRFDEMRGATSQQAIDALREFEDSVATDARRRCKERGIVADQVGIARMTSELVAEDSTLYDRYSRLQRAVAAGG